MLSSTCGPSQPTVTPTRTSSALTPHLAPRLGGVGEEELGPVAGIPTVCLVSCFWSLSPSTVVLRLNSLVLPPHNLPSWQ